MNEFVARLYEAHAAELAAALAFSTGSLEAAHNLTHQVFIEAQASALELEEDPRLWLYVSAYRLLRRRARLTTPRYGVIVRRPLLSEPVWEGMAELRTVLAQLSSRRRDAVVLHDYARLELPQVAAILRCNEETASSEAYWGRAELDGILEADGGVEPAGRESFDALVETAQPVHEDVLGDLSYVPVSVTPAARSRRVLSTLAVALVLIGGLTFFQPWKNGGRRAAPAVEPSYSLARLAALATRRPMVAGDALQTPTPVAQATLTPGSGTGGGNTPIATRSAPVPTTAKRPCARGSTTVVQYFDNYDNLPEESLYAPFTPRIVIATVEGTGRARWSTPDGCEPETVAYPSDTNIGLLPGVFEVRRPVTYKPLRLRVEQTLVNKLLAPPQAEYALYGGTLRGGGLRTRGPIAPPAELKHGHRYLLWIAQLRHESDPPDATRALIVAQAVEIDPRGRARLASGKAVPLSTLLTRIRQEVGPRALTPSLEPLPLDERANLIQVGGIVYEGNP